MGAYDAMGEPPVLIIGSGPAGMAAAVCLARHGVEFDLVDRRGQGGGAYRDIYGAVTLQSPARYTALPGLRLRHAGEYITAAQYFQYLEHYLKHHALSPRRAVVEKIERRGDHFAVRFAGQPQVGRYEIVVAATGMFDFPLWPTIPGLNRNDQGPHILHARDWRGPKEFAGQRVLVIGGATGAIEIAEECARAAVSVIVSTRSGLKIGAQRFLGRDVHDWAYVLVENLPPWVLGPYCGRRPTLPGEDRGFHAFRDQGLIEVRGPLERFDGKTAYFRDGTQKAIDVVVVATGYEFRMDFLPEAIRRAPAGHPVAEHGESVSWPGLFFVGAPCARGLASEFLRGIAKDALAIARAICTRLARLECRRVL